MLHPGHVVVVGSGNLDIVMALERLPRPGETIMGDRMEEVAGGKGLNQAIAAARHATSAFVGCFGNDAAGSLLKQRLEGAGVDTEYLVRGVEPTGRAFIQVTPDGENNIVVVSLANSRLDADHVVAALDVLRPAVVLTQLEIPFRAVEATAEWSESNGAIFVLNPSPIIELPRSLLERCDPLILNAAEAESILGTGSAHVPRSSNDVSAEDLAARLAELVRSVVVTDGSHGAYVGTGHGGIRKIAGKQVVAVDTTGAGDEFAGVLSAGLARGVDLGQAAEMANESAARLVQVQRSER